MSEFMWRLIHLNPALWRGVIIAGVLLLASVGVKISPDIPDQAILFLGALFPLIQAMWTRGAVTPNAKVAVSVPDPHGAPDVVAAGDASTNATSADIIEAARAGTP